MGKHSLFKDLDWVKEEYRAPFKGEESIFQLQQLNKSPILGQIAGIPCLKAPVRVLKLFSHLMAIGNFI